MRILDIGHAIARPVDRFGSTGFDVAPLAQGNVTIVRLHVEPGGRIGRHDSVGEQLLFVLEGQAMVSGHDGVEHAIRAGEAALWATGESHETRSVGGFSGLAIEGDFTLIAEG